MNDLKQIHTALERLFNEEGQRIVFWNDPDKAFVMTMPLNASSFVVREFEGSIVHSGGYRNP